MATTFSMKRPKLIDLNDAIQHPGRQVEFDVSAALDEEEDLDLLDPVRGHLEAVSSGNVLFVKGDLHAEVVMECSRCLAPIPLQVDFKLEEEFPVMGTPAGHGGHDYAEVQEIDEPSPLFEGNQLRYEDLIRQALWLNLPMRPLCKEDCAGISEGGDADEHGRPEFKALSKLLDEEAS
jgi:uncharacterized metal-binding protein YceD (DUF177 family)